MHQCLVLVLYCPPHPHHVCISRTFDKKSPHDVWVLHHIHDHWTWSGSFLAIIFLSAFESSFLMHIFTKSFFRINALRSCVASRTRALILAWVGANMEANFKQPFQFDHTLSTLALTLINMCLAFTSWTLNGDKYTSRRGNWQEVNSNTNNRRTTSRKIAIYD